MDELFDGVKTLITVIDVVVVHARQWPGTQQRLRKRIQRRIRRKPKHGLAMLLAQMHQMRPGLADRGVLVAGRLVVVPHPLRRRRVHREQMQSRQGQDAVEEIVTREPQRYRVILVRQRGLLVQVEMAGGDDEVVQEV